MTRAGAQTTTLLLVRHGQSTWNAAGRWQGHADPPLSPLGEEQARQAGARLASDGRIDAVVTSDLRRAHRTATLVGAVLGLDASIEERVRERDAGEWTGLTRDDIDRDWPGYLAEHRRPPRFEDDATLLARVLPALAELGARHAGGRVLVVTHGGVVRTVERHHGTKAPPLANLGGRAVHVSVDGSALVVGDPVLLVDGDDVAITVPNQI
ncbi:MAG TPA: histidine phosphatase family protein [Acidimicrobiia bacterium]|nr:histidine phosphatase family protein [Acidimicrobiia bacterium]